MAVDAEDAAFVVELIDHSSAPGFGLTFQAPGSRLQPPGLVGSGARRGLESGGWGLEPVRAGPAPHVTPAAAQSELPGRSPKRVRRPPPPRQPLVLRRPASRSVCRRSGRSLRR